MFNAFQWNCFNLIYTHNIALILFLKCDVTQFRIPPPLSRNVTLRRPLPPLTCDVIYGLPLTPWDWVVQLYPQALSTHFSRLLRHACATLGLFLYPGYHKRCGIIKEEYYWLHVELPEGR